MKKIKILYFIPQLTVGGTERHLCDLIKHLNKEKYEPTVWSPGPWGPIGDELTQSGIKVVRFMFPDNILALDRLIKLFCYLRCNKFDIFQSYGYGPHYKDAVIAKLIGIPIYISTRRNMRYWKHGENLHFGERIRNALSRIIVANAEAVKDKSIAVEKLEREKIIVIHNGVDYDTIPPFLRTSELRRQFNIGQNEIVVGNLANLKTLKGQDRLIVVFADLLKRFHNVKLIIIGEGAEKASLLELAKKNNIDDKVIITNMRWDRFDLLSAFDIFALSSFTEGFPNVILEAMAVRRPVIASCVGGIPEAIINGEVGFLFETDVDFISKLSLLVENSKLREDMGAKGQERVKKLFSMNDKVKEYEKLYENLLCSKRD